MNSGLSVTAIINDEVAAVEISGIGPGGWHDEDRKGIGWAKRHPRDAPNTDIAFNLAMARALQDLAHAYAAGAANLAGFPVVVDLPDTVDSVGQPVSVTIFPTALANADTTEKVSF